LLKITDVNADTWISILSKLGIPLVLVYVYFMFIAPFFKGDWNYVLNVWHNWQSLNVGILAFISSLIAFNISRYNSDKQRQREFIASRAFLPNALSLLSDYTKQSAELLKESWNIKNDWNGSSTITLQSNLPKVDSSINKVFAECIRHGSPEVAENLATILVKLQVNDSRLTSLFEGNIRHLNHQNLRVYMYCLGEIKALVDSLFTFARGREKFIVPELSLSALHTAYLNLEIHEEFVEGLSELTEKMLSNENA